jgi:sulfotransferase
MLEQMNPGREFADFFDTNRRRALLRGIFEACYADAGPEDVVFDTNRMWTGQTALLRELYPQVRIICCVREIGWILNSIERLLMQNPLQTSRLFDFKAGTSFYARMQNLMHTDFGNVGLALSELRATWFSPGADLLVVVRYESLVLDPEQVMRRLYEVLGEPFFQHDFQNLIYDDPEYDARLGMPGLHKVAPRVEPQNHQAIIPPEIFVRHADLAFWNRPQENPRGVLVI